LSSSNKLQSSSIQSQLAVSIGLGPETSLEEDEEEQSNRRSFDIQNIPDHEAYRTSRRSAIDERCDVWFEALLGSSESETTPNHPSSFLQHLADHARQRLITPVELKNEVSISI
jgi:hypothetical protein